MYLNWCLFPICFVILFLSDTIVSIKVAMRLESLIKAIYNSTFLMPKHSPFTIKYRSIISLTTLTFQLCLEIVKLIEKLIKIKTYSKYTSWIKISLSLIFILSYLFVIGVFHFIIIIFMIWKSHELTTIWPCKRTRTWIWH